MEYIANTLNNLIHQTAFFNLTWGNYVMIVVACVLPKAIGVSSKGSNPFRIAR